MKELSIEIKYKLTKGPEWSGNNQWSRGQSLIQTQWSRRNYSGTETILHMDKKIYTLALSSNWEPFTHWSIEDKDGWIWDTIKRDGQYTFVSFAYIT